MGGGGGPVAIVGAGLKAPGGNTVDELWASLCAGRTTAARFTDPRFGPAVRMLACRVDGFDPLDYLKPAEVRRMDRSHVLAIGAAQDAVTSFGDEGWPPPERRAVVCGVGYGVAALVERQVTTLLDSRPEGREPAGDTDGDAELGGRPPVAALRTSPGPATPCPPPAPPGPTPSARASSSSARRRGPRAGGRGGRAAHLHHRQHVPPDGGDERERRAPGAGLPTVRRRPGRLRPG